MFGGGGSFREGERVNEGFVNLHVSKAEEYVGTAGVEIGN